jgi:sec-independent protein translocase protein TatA
MLALFSLGNGEMLVILIVAFLLFGSRLPSAMRSLGRSVTEFKRGMRDVEEEMNKPGQDEVKKDDAKKEESLPSKPA